MSFKTRINPATGKLETIGDSSTDDAGAARQATEKLRREVRDMISGNVQFHEDKLGPGPKPAEPTGSLVALWQNRLNMDEQFVTRLQFVSQLGPILHDALLSPAKLAGLRPGDPPPHPGYLLADDYWAAGLTADTARRELGCFVSVWGRDITTRYFEMP